MLSQLENMELSDNLKIALYTVAAILAAYLFVMLTAAHAHDAPASEKQPLGWTYPWQCCSGLDCKPMNDGVEETPQGYRIKPTGEVVPYGDKRIKDSPDGMFHWCAHQAGPDKDHTICLFVPPRGY